LLSISVEKSSGAWSSRAERDEAFGKDRLAVSDVTLSTGGLSKRFVLDQQRPGHVAAGTNS
jgi:hypothetical protein